MSDKTDIFDALWSKMDRADKNHVRRKVREAEQRALRTKFKTEAEEVLNFLNTKAGKNFRVTDTNLDFIVGRLKDGVSLEQCKAIIVRKCRSWKGTDMEPCLRPATLFNKTKCEQYLGELG